MWDHESELCCKDDRYCLRWALSGTCWKWNKPDDRLKLWFKREFLKHHLEQVREEKTQNINIYPCYENRQPNHSDRIDWLGLGCRCEWRKEMGDTAMRKHGEVLPVFYFLTSSTVPFPALYPFSTSSSWILHFTLSWLRLYFSPSFPVC